MTIRNIRRLATALGLCLTAPLLAAAPQGQGPLRIEGVRLVDPARSAEAPAEDAVLVIEAGTIVYAGPATSAPEVSGARVVDGEGLSAIPGLVDMHVHVWDRASLGAYLASGITTVRNMSGMPFHLALAQRIEQGEVDGPHLLTTGPILNSPGPNQQINHQLVGAAAEAKAAVAAQDAAGYQRIKVYSNLTREAYEAVRDEAAARGMRIAGHTPEGARAPGIPQDRPFAIGFDEIVDDGFETIEHVESIVWHGLRDRRDPVAARRLAQRIAAAGVPVTPTLVAHRNLARVAATDGAYARRPGTERLNPVTQRTEAGHIAGWAARDPAPEEEAAAFYQQFVRILDQAGVLLVAGSDAGIFTNIPGVSLHDEFDLLAEAGFSPVQIITMATHNAAVAVGQGKQSGCLASDCIADIVFYACNPLSDVTCLRHPEAVVRSGRWLSRERLAELDAAASQHDPGRTIANLVEGMAAQGTPIDPAMLGQ